VILFLIIIFFATKNYFWFEGKCVSHSYVKTKKRNRQIALVLCQN